MYQQTATFHHFNCVYQRKWNILHAFCVIHLVDTFCVDFHRSFILLSSFVIGTSLISFYLTVLLQLTLEFACEFTVIENNRINRKRFNRTIRIVLPDRYVRMPGTFHHVKLKIEIYIDQWNVFASKVRHWYWSFYIYLLIYLFIGFHFNTIFHCSSAWLDKCLVCLCVWRFPKVVIWLMLPQTDAIWSKQPFLSKYNNSNKREPKPPMTHIFQLKSDLSPR